MRPEGGPEKASDPEVLDSLRQEAAGLGANGLLLNPPHWPDGPAPVVAIYVAADTQRVLDECAKALAQSGTPALAPSLAAALGTDPMPATEPADSAPPRHSSPGTSTAAASEPLVIVTPRGRPIARPTRVRSNAEMVRDPLMRQTLGDVTRLRIADEYEEARPGLLVLALGPGFSTVTSTEYNLRRLFAAYRGYSGWSDDVVMELWRFGEKVGEYTADGLLMGPAYSRPR